MRNDRQNARNYRHWHHKSRARGRAHMTPRPTIADIESCRWCKNGIIPGNHRVPPHRCQDCRNHPGVILYCPECSMVLGDNGDEINGERVESCPKCERAFMMRSPHNEVRK